MHPACTQVLWLMIFSISGVLLLLPIPKGHERANRITSILGIGIAFSVVILPPFSNQPRISGNLGFLLRIVGFFLFATGGGIVVVGGRKYLFESGKSSPGIRGKPKKLLTTGVYGMVRHPVYTGIVLGAIGWSLVWRAVYSLFLIPPAIFLAYAAAAKILEEPMLIERFGEKYRDYKEEVPAFFPLPLKIILIILILAVLFFTIWGRVPIH